MTMRRLRRPAALLGAATIVAVTVLWGATPATAEPDSVAVRRVDATDELVTFDVVAPGATDAKGLRLEIDGKEVELQAATRLADAGESTEAMFVLDNSELISNGAVQIAKEQLVERVGPGTAGIDRAGAVTIGGGAIRRSGLATNGGQLLQSIGTLAPTGATALWDGVVTAAKAFGSPNGSSRHIVIVTGTADSISTAAFTDVVAAVREAQASVHVVAIAGGTSELESLQALTRRVGGDLRVVEVDQLQSALTDLGSTIASGWRLTASLPGQKSDQVLAASITWDGVTTKFGYEPGVVSLGNALIPPVGDLTGIEALLASTVVKYVIVLLACAAAGMVVYSFASLLGRRSERLSFALRHYEGFTVETPTDEWDDDGEGSYAKGAVMKRAVKLTGDLAQRQGLLSRVEELLERADLPLRPAEALFFYVAIVTLATAGAALVMGSPLVILVVLLVAILAPRFVVDFLAKRRAKKFVSQLPDMLQLLAGTLRAGYSIGQGFEAVSKEVDGPMGQELRRIMAEARLGRPLEEALDAAALRVKSDDFGWAVMAIRIQREVGGNLAELLMTVAETMTQRERLRRDVASLTAEGRMSAIVLGCLPPGLGAVMMAMNPKYISKLFEGGIGYFLIGAAVVAMLVGFAWMKKIVSIEI